MKARYSYPLLFLIPSAMVAAANAVVVAGVGAGVLWLFVYGDSAWPESARAVLTVFALVAAVLTLVMLLHASYRFGRRREAAGGLRPSHVLLAIALSLALPLLAVLHQWQVGNLGDRGSPVPAGTGPVLVQ